MENQTPPPATSLPVNRTPLIVALVAATGGLILLCVFAFLLLRGEGLSGIAGGDRATPTPFPTGVAESADYEPISVRIGAESVTLAISAPTFLHIGDKSYAIQREPISPDGTWSPSIASDTSAVWLNGTIINYILALADTAANRATMEALVPGARLALSTREGETRTFEFDSRTIVPVTNRDVFSQTTPGLTLVLVGLGSAGQDRMVVQGRFVVGDLLETGGSGGSGGAGNTARLGETVSLGGLELTANLFGDRPSQAGGFSFFLVDYTLRNRGNLALDTRILQFTLVDDAGNQYALNPEAAQMGSHPPLGTVISPGETVNATAGFRIPGGLDASVLTWRVARSDSGELAQIRTGSPSDPTMPVVVSVILTSAELSPDAGSLILQGQITNPGSQPALIAQTDVTLVSEGALYLLLSTNPAFPWVVSPGQTIPFAVAVQRPANADTAVFTVLGQAFELTGLR